MIMRNNNLNYEVQKMNLTEQEIKKLKKEGKWTVLPMRKAKGSRSPFCTRHPIAKRVRRGPSRA